MSYEDSNSTNLTCQNKLSDFNIVKGESLSSPNPTRSLAKPKEHLSETSNSE